MTIEQIISKIDSLGTNKAFLIPCDLGCLAFVFRNSVEAAEQLNEFSNHFKQQGMDTEYSISSMGNVQVWDNVKLCYEFKDSFRIDAVNDYTIKFFEEMSNSDWTKD